jgi:hypothetical protein
MSTVIYSPGIVSTSVCTDDTDEEMLAVVNAEYPTGLEYDWTISTDPTFHTGQPNPTPCEQDPTRRHVLLVC